MSSSQSPVKPVLAPSDRLNNVAPYALAKVFQDRDEKIRQGVDVIDLLGRNPRRVPLLEYKQWHTLRDIAEFFNGLNRTLLNNPNTTVTSATFGRITSARDPRILQMALKLTF